MVALHMPHIEIVCKKTSCIMKLNSIHILLVEIHKLLNFLPSGGRKRVNYIERAVLYTLHL